LHDHRTEPELPEPGGAEKSAKKNGCGYTQD